MRLKLFLVLVIFCAIVLAVFMYTKTTTETPAPTTTPSPYPLSSINRWQNIDPGASTLEDAVKNLGPSVESIQTEAGTVHYFPTTKQYWKNEVTIRGGKVSFILERIFQPANTSLKSLSSKIPGQPIQLYGPDFEGGTFLFVYPSEGIGFIASPFQDIVYQIWRFPPTTLDVFLSLPQAKDYGINPKAEPEAY